MSTHRIHLTVDFSKAGHLPSDIVGTLRDVLRGSFAYIQTASVDAFENGKAFIIAEVTAGGDFIEANTQAVQGEAQRLINKNLKITEPKSKEEHRPVKPIDSPEPAGSSSDGGDWTTTGDGTDYPKDNVSPKTDDENPKKPLETGPGPVTINIQK